MQLEFRNPYPFLRVFLPKKDTLPYGFFSKYWPIFQNFQMFAGQTPENLEKNGILQVNSYNLRLFLIVLFCGAIN